jgi:hypothetical protein
MEYNLRKFNYYSNNNAPHHLLRGIVVINGQAK